MVEWSMESRLNESLPITRDVRARRARANRSESAATLGLAAFLVIASLADPVLTMVASLLYSGAIVMRHRVRYGPAVLLLPTLIFMLTGLIATGTWGVEQLVIFMRSAFYALFPLAMLAMGMAVSNVARRAQTYYRAIVYAGLILGLVYLFQYFTSGIGPNASRYELREEVGRGFLVTAVAVAIGLTRARQMPWGRFVSIAAVFPMLAAVLLSDSRTGLVVIAGLIAAMTVLRPARGFASPISVVLVIVLLIITTPLLSGLLGSEAVQVFEDFGGLRELFAYDYITFSDINNYWRGFETARTFAFVTSHGGFATLFGMGWGSDVPLNVTIRLAGEMTSSIGKFHSIYSQILMRGGYFGIAMYVTQIGLLSVACSRPSVIDSDLRRLGFGIIICAALAGPAVGGLYAPSGNGAIFALIAGAVAGGSFKPRAGAKRPSTAAPDRLNVAGVSDPT